MTPHSASPESITNRAPRGARHRGRRVLVALALTSAAVLVLLSLATPAGATASGGGPASLGPGLGRDIQVLSVTDALRCAKPAHYVGFTKPRAVIAVAIGLGESTCIVDAKGHNPPSGNCPNGSDDRGLWQINSCYHPEVSDHCAYHANCNARAAKRISGRGRDWTPWSVFNSGAYKQYLDVAQQAVDQVYGTRSAGVVATPRK